MLYNFEELSFCPITVDRFYHREGVFDVKARRYASLSYRICGRGSFEVGGCRLEIEPGDVLFLPADTPYRVEYSVSESIVVHFEHCNYTQAEKITSENRGAMELCFRRLLEVWSEEHSVNGVKALIYGFLEQMERDRRLSVEHTAFAACVRYLDAHFCDPELDIAAVCRVGYISPSGLQRAFRSHLGLSPIQYWTKLRMNRAIELLMERRLTVKEVAFACGYTDEKYFSRAFKKRFGYPPSQCYEKVVV